MHDSLPNRSGLSGVLVLLVLTGCASVRPDRITADRMEYGQVIADSWKRQTLLNVVRLRYADAPVFLDVVSVINSYSVGGNASGTATLPSNADPSVFTLNAQGTWSNTPTVTYQPLLGDRFTKSLLQPVPPAAVFRLLQGGWPADLVMQTVVGSINGLRNESDGVDADPNFRLLLEAMTRIQRAAGLGIRVETQKDGSTVVVLLLRADADATSDVAVTYWMNALQNIDPSRPLFVSLNPPFDPAPDLTGAEGVNLTPDVVVRLRWEPRGGPENLLRTPAHVQGAVLIRTLRGDLVDQPEVTLSTRGFGGTVSGVLVPRWKSDDRFKFAAYGGWGIGRYITDLGAEGGQDAVYDPATNALRALPVSSAYIGYEHPWRPSFTSSVTYGVVTVHNLLIQPGGALHRTQRATVNVTWNPITRADVVLEFLTGERVNKDGQRGLSSQIQAGWKVRF